MLPLPLQRLPSCQALVDELHRRRILHHLQLSMPHQILPGL
jgi:hypothetical protein